MHTVSQIVDYIIAYVYVIDIPQPLNHTEFCFALSLINCGLNRTQFAIPIGCRLGWIAAR